MSAVTKMAPKRYCVVIDQQQADGSVVQRPFDRRGRLGAFPDHSGSRSQALKQLRRVLAEFPSARLWVCREL